MIWFWTDESEATGYGAPAAGMVVGVDTTEERLDVGDVGVAEDGFDGSSVV